MSGGIQEVDGYKQGKGQRYQREDKEKQINIIMYVNLKMKKRLNGIDIE